jgi:hypothetical protein
VNKQRQNAATDEERYNMKKIILAVAVAGALTFVANANAGDAIMSPKAQEQADSHRTVSGTTPDMIDRSIRAGSPKQVEFAASLRTVPSIGPSVDLAHAPRPNLSPKDPNYDIAFRENAMKQLDIQVAPLK